MSLNDDLSPSAWMVKEEIRRVRRVRRRLKDDEKEETKRFLRLKRCPICGGGELVKDMTWKMARCRKCGTLLTYIKLKLGWKLCYFDYVAGTWKMVNEKKFEEEKLVFI